MDSKKKLAAQAGNRSAQRVLQWLRRGGRKRVRQVVQQAVKQTAARNKARQLDPHFLDRRVTF